ncbi:MAG: helix-turn-helix domain-containing protein [Oscillospiraceae bacterium]|nr:helix-turn-helix domain-containing protein [Oscillospiraceae bacterium]
MSEDLKHTPEILSAKDLQEMGFSRSMSYALFNREDIPIIRIGKRKFIRREKFLEWLAEQERTDRE